MVAGWHTLVGANQHQLELTGLTQADTTKYSCAVGTAAGTNTSGTVSLTVLPRPACFGHCFV